MKRTMPGIATKNPFFTHGKIVRMPPTNRRIGAPNAVRYIQAKGPVKYGVNITRKPKNPVTSAVTRYSTPANPFDSVTSVVDMTAARIVPRRQFTTEFSDSVPGSRTKAGPSSADVFRTLRG